MVDFKNDNVNMNANTMPDRSYMMKRVVEQRGSSSFTPQNKHVSLNCGLADASVGAHRVATVTVAQRAFSSHHDSRV